jgi:tetratricopeptide (TPR) repeat protein
MGFGVTRRGLAGAAVVALVTCSSVDALALGPPPHPPRETSDKARAQELFKKSADAYLHGDFAQAIALLDEAYALDPQPVLVYNKARAHEGLGHVDEAITLYEQYLAQEPTSPDRGAIEQRLATLKRQRDERLAAEKERAAAEKERAAAEKERADHPPPPPPKRSVYPYVVAGVGAAGLATGTIFGLMTLSKESSAKSEPVQSTSIDLRDKARSFATVSNVSFVIGGVLVAAGVVWWVFDGQRIKRTGGAPVRIGLGPGSIAVGGVLP